MRRTPFLLGTIIAIGLGRPANLLYLEEAYFNVRPDIPAYPSLKSVLAKGKGRKRHSKPMRRWPGRLY